EAPCELLQPTALSEQRGAIRVREELPGCGAGGLGPLRRGGGRHRRLGRLRARLRSSETCEEAMYGPAHTQIDAVEVDPGHAAGKTRERGHEEAGQTCRV